MFILGGPPQIVQKLGLCWSSHYSRFQVAWRSRSNFAAATLRGPEDYKNTTILQTRVSRISKNQNAGSLRHVVDCAQTRTCPSKRQHFLRKRASRVPHRKLEPVLRKVRLPSGFQETLTCLYMHVDICVYTYMCVHGHTYMYI